MSWESPNLSKGDVELLTVSLDDYIFYAKQENNSDTYDVERLLVRLEEYLQRSD
jgi:hypothetical protein